MKKIGRGSSVKLQEAYQVSLIEATKLHDYLTMLRQKQLRKGEVPKFYREIDENDPIPPVEIKLKCNDVDACNCSAKNPCGPESNCINRALSQDCDASCPTGDACMNQRIRQKKNAPVQVVSTPFSGFGLITEVDLAQGSFVAEYVGELITEAEKKRRLEVMIEMQEKNFYFMSLSNNIYIDAFPAGNKSRFMNHSCDPNCITKTISVDGVKHIGIFAIRDIPKVTIIKVAQSFLN
jgi:SET domain-containing protein